MSLQTRVRATLASRVASVALLQPLAIRDFRRLWTGMTVSLLGDGVLLVALAWQVYELSNAPTALAIVGLATALPQVVLLLVGGVVSDRFDRRRVMVASDVARGASVAVLAVLSLTGALQLWEIFALAAIYGGASAFFAPAFDAIVPDVVPAERLAEANALDQFARPAAMRLAGPALGGVIVAGAGAGWAFAIDALTFAFAAVCVLRMRPPARVNREKVRVASALAEAREGFRFVRAHVWLWGTFLGASFSYLLFIGPTAVLLPYVIKNDLHAGAGTLGAVVALGGVGSLAAAAIQAQIGMPRRNMTVIYMSWSVATFAVAGYGLAVLPWQLMIASVVFNALETVGTVVWATTKQRFVPSSLLGRVSSFDWFISIALVPVSFGLTGPVAAAVGARTTLIGAGLIGGVTTLAFLFLPGMRDVERRSHGGGAALGKPAMSGP